MQILRKMFLFGTFDYFFGAYLLHSILRHTDNLSKTMQQTEMSAAEGQHLSSITNKYM